MELLDCLSRFHGDPYGYPGYPLLLQNSLLEQSSSPLSLFRTPPFFTMVCLRSAKPNAGQSTQVSQGRKGLPETGSGQTIQSQVICHSQETGNNTQTQPPSFPLTHTEQSLSTLHVGTKRGESPQEGEEGKRVLPEGGVGKKKAVWQFVGTLLLQVALKSLPSVTDSGQAEGQPYLAPLWLRRLLSTLALLLVSTNPPGRHWPQSWSI